MKVSRRRIIPAVRLPAYGSLLAANFVLLLLTPFFAILKHGILVERAIFGAMLVAAFVATGMPRGDAWKLLLIMVLFFVAGLAGDVWFKEITIAFRVGILVWAEVRILRQFLAEQEVGWDTVAAAAAGFVLIAVIWGNLFVMLEYWRPGSFTIPPEFVIGGDVRAALQYFSFVTLTTVGYGEIHPADVGAGGVCVAEALFGQLYLAVMISRMVGLHLAGSRPASKSSAEEA